MTTKEDDKKKKFNFWIYIGFIIIAFLFSLVIIGSLYYLFSNKTSSSSPIIPSNNSNSNSIIPITNASASVSASASNYSNNSNSASVSNNSNNNSNSNYISSLFKKGGNYKKILKRF